MADTDAERDQLELLASDFLARLRRGESPSIADYAQAYPALATEIRELFPTVRAAEQIKLPQGQWLQQEENGSKGSDRTVPLEGKPTDQGETAPHPGMVLGKYTLEKCIGRGSLGSVWTSRHPEFGIPVAVKILHASVKGSTDEGNRRFLREARAAARLNHPHIVRVFDAGVADGLKYLVMEYAEGGTVASLQESLGGKLPVDRAVQLVAATVEAVDAASQLGIVHRDIKPENILLDAGGQPKLADLGLAKETLDAETHSVTRVGQIMGTPFYIAPEQAMGSSEVDVRTDIYSLGATLYHLVTGKPPFDGPTLYEIFHGHLHRALVEPRVQNPEVPPALSRIICRMMEKRPEDRYQSTAELRADLARYLAGQKVAARPRLRHWLPYVSGSLLLLALLGTLYLAFSGPHDRETAGAPAAPSSPPEKTAVPAATDATKPTEPASRATVPPPAEMAADNWQIVDGPLGVKEHFPTPLPTADYQFVGNALQISEKAGTMRTLVYSAVPILGPFRLTAGVRNINVLGIVGAPGEEMADCQVVLFNPAEVDPSDDTWHTVDFHRDRNSMACLVDGKPAFSLTGSPRAHGRVWFSIPSDARSEIRGLALRAEEVPLPAGGRSGFPPPRRP